ncbi:2-oxo acid dehydrogenase subunit E2 [candidate division KSB1 bacterium]|nr:2-oxo acid dehydrogenase subunit E2 [candidate division KSB1 bacterium]
MKFVFRLPDVGEGIHEAEVINYEVAVGDAVQADQVVIKVETDKAVVTLPSPVTGTVLETPLNPGDIVEVGGALIVLEAEGDSELTVSENDQLAEVAASKSKKKADKSIPVIAGMETPLSPIQAKRVLATPHTRHLARRLGIDISTVSGTGRAGRVTDDDVHRAAETGPAVSTGHQRSSLVGHDATSAGFDFEKYGPTQREPLKGIRKRIAEVMVRSYTTIPHVTHADEADITDLMNVVRSQKPAAEARGIKLTLTTFLTKAVVAALKQFPDLNASIDDGAGEIVFKNYFHIGIATDTEHGLMVPVVQNADQKSVLQIARDIQQLAEKARNREIDLDELRGGTFTITNPGVIGGIHATPIIQHPQVAILATLAARKRPVVRDDEIVIRTMMPMVIAFDHRLIDGATGARFMNYIISLLQDPMKMMLDMV